MSPEPNVAGSEIHTVVTQRRATGKQKWANNDETYVAGPLHTRSFIVVSLILRFYGLNIVDVSKTIFTTLKFILARKLPS